jgi:hypothetical protein
MAYLPRIHSVVRDLRDAVRAIRRAPMLFGFAASVLVLGVGVSAGLFLLFNALALRPLPVEQPDRLIELWTQYPGEPRLPGGGWVVFQHFREQTRTLSDLTAVSPSAFQLSLEAAPETTNGEYVAGNFFWP